jgi:hypothetical protein
VVHLDHAGLPGCLGLGDERSGGVELLVVLGQELGGGDEQRAGQTGVGVRAGFLQRQTAVAVGQRHFRPGEVLLHPRALGQRPVDGNLDRFAPYVDLLSALFNLHLKQWLATVGVTDELARPVKVSTFAVMRRLVPRLGGLP